MKCEHKRIRCTNGEFFCLDCGEKLEQPKAEKEQPKRRATKKGAAKE